MEALHTPEQFEPEREVASSVLVQLVVGNVEYTVVELQLTGPETQVEAVVRHQPAEAEEELHFALEVEEELHSAPVVGVELHLVLEEAEELLRFGLGVDLEDLLDLCLEEAWMAHLFLEEAMHQRHQALEGEAFQPWLLEGQEVHPVAFQEASLRLAVL